MSATYTEMSKQAIFIGEIAKYKGWQKMNAYILVLHNIKMDKSMNENTHTGRHNYRAKN